MRGVDVLGLLPAEFQSPLIMTSGIGAHPSTEAQSALLQFLAGPKAAPLIKASGMEGLCEEISGRENSA